MITNNVLQRVFNIKNGNNTGTAFTIDVDNRQYFVTATHVVEGIANGSQIKIWYDQTWKVVPFVLIGQHSKADVTVFSINQIIPSYPMEATSEGLTLGQDIYFLGFPHGLKSEVGEINRLFPLPLVKKGCVASLPFLYKQENVGQYMWIDGNNNPGFSGGPVIFKASGDNNFRVCGVIHGYMTTLTEVEEIESTTTKQVVRNNTGIMKVYDIECAINLIKANPNGVVIPSVS
jgi:S1-C subfamily serine protease